LAANFPISKLTLDDLVDIAQTAIDPSSVGYAAPLGSVLIRSNGQLWVKVGVADTDWDRVKVGTQIGVDQMASTGLLDGGTLSINVDTTKFDVEAGIGIIVDNYTDTLNPTATIVTWGASTANVVTNLATTTRSFIAINSAGSVVQSGTPWTNTEHKDNIIVGNLGHANLTSIVGLRNNPDPAIDATARLADLARAIGSLNIEGNIFGPNGNNILLNKSSGVTYRLGNNFSNNKRDADSNTDASGTVVPFIYSYQDGVGGHTLVTPPVTAVDSSNYDDGTGTLSSMPNGRWQIQIIKYFSGIEGVATTRIEYGQQTFSTKAAALDVLPDAQHIHNPAFAEGVIRAYLLVSAGAVDLSDPAEAEFIEAAKFGQGGGGQFSGSVTTLQQAYDNSVNPEILTDATRGAVTITEGAAVGGNLIEGIDDGATTVFAVAVDGSLTATPINNLNDVNATPAANDVLTWSGTEWQAAAPPGATGGEANTASSVGIGGISIVEGKVGVDLQFKSINAGSNLISISDDLANNEVDIDLNQANIVITESQISDLQAYSLTDTTDHTLFSNIGTNSHATIDAHIVDGTIHYTQAAISITESQISDLGSYSLTTHVHEGTEIDATAITDGFVLTADGAGNSVWEASAGGGASAINDLTDVVITTAANGEVLTFNGTNWVNQPAGAGSDVLVKVSANDTTSGYLNGKLVAGTGVSLVENNDAGNETLSINADGLVINDLTDVNTTTPGDGDVIFYNDTAGEWQNTQLFTPGTEQSIQQVSGSVPALSGTTIIVQTTTAPLITEGTELWSQVFTPSQTGGSIKISQSFAFLVTNASSAIIIALYRDNVCIGVMNDSATNGGKFQVISFIVKDPTPGVAATPITYSVRVGKESGNATWYINEHDSILTVFGSVLTNNAYVIEEVVTL